MLGYNYPGSQWYRDAYALVTGTPLPAAGGEGWFTRVVGGIF